MLYARSLQRTCAATEAIHLLMRYAFEDLGYRRFEWKCDSLNEPSRRAAARLGFTYEGRFRHHMVTKGRNRDTDWFSVTDAEWPAVRAAHEAWLDPANFDENGEQRTALSSMWRRHGVPRRHDRRRCRTTTLSPNDIEQAELEDWRVLFDALHARFRTEDFATGLKLVKKIGKAAEKADHHPDVDLSYGQVDVRLSSHDAGGVTERDVDLARQISGFASDVDAEPAPGSCR